MILYLILIGERDRMMWLTLFIGAMVLGLWTGLLGSYYFEVVKK